MLYNDLICWMGVIHPIVTLSAIIKTCDLHSFKEQHENSEHLP